MAASWLEASTCAFDELVREARVERDDLSAVNAHLGRASVQRVDLAHGRLAEAVWDDVHERLEAFMKARTAGLP